MAVERIHDPLPADGRVGIAPPPGADTTPSQPLTADAGTIIGADGLAYRPIDKARANERELAPLTYRDPVAQAAAELAGTATPGVIAAPAPVKAAVVAAAPRPADPTQPAASNTDSPSRGIPGTAYSPHRSKDPMAVEGGFGAGSGEYFALDGTELRTCAELLMEELLDQIQNDTTIVALTGDTAATLHLILTVPDRPESGEPGFTMELTGANPDGDLPQAIETLLDELDASLTSDLRFGLAASYPQYAVELALTVKAHPADPGFVLKKHRREQDEHEMIETPPDALREELGLPIPGKQTVFYEGPIGAISSDVRI